MSRLWWRRKGSQGSSLTCSTDRRKDSLPSVLSALDTSLTSRASVAWPEEDDNPGPWVARCLEVNKKLASTRRLSGDVYSLLGLASLNTQEDCLPHAKFLRQKSDRAIRAEPAPNLPIDPRAWSREDVSVWLDFTVKRNGLPFITAQSFMMNGKGLCLLTMDMFCVRAPLGGKALFKDFQLRLTVALHEPTPRSQATMQHCQQFKPGFFQEV